MIEIIKHRVNTVSLLIETPTEFGVEVDLRSQAGELIFEHDPLTPGTLARDWLPHFNHARLIVNIKEEGLEIPFMELLSKFGITNYFFLDQSFPFLVRLVRSGNTQTALRVSDLESIETVHSIETDWIWLDSFSGDWEYLERLATKLQNSRVKTCLVSPELHRADFEKELLKLRSMISKIALKIDAVCTKYPEKWA